MLMGCWCKLAMLAGQPQSNYWNSKQPPKHRIPPLFKGYLDNLVLQSKNQKLFKSILFQSLDEQKDPLTFALDLVLYGSTFLNSRRVPCKKGGWLVLWILKFVAEWCERHDVSWLLTKEVKAKALIVAVECSNGSNERIICNVFQLPTERESAKNIVYRLLSNRDFKKAYYLISALDLEQEFDMKHCLFPLLFIELEQYVKQYLTKAPCYQIPFVVILDDICRDSDRLKDFVRSVNADGLYQSKTLSLEKYVPKKLATFVEFFNIDIKHCPNLYHYKISKAMHYLFNKRYIEGSIEYIPWEELTVDLIEEHPDLQKELLVKLVCANEAPAALKLANIFKISPEDWPDALKCVSDSILKSNLDDLDKKANVVAEHFLHLRLNRSDVYLVDTPKKLFEAVDDIAENYDIVGMDVEWKPDLGINFNKGLSKVALLQLAVWDAVYLIDIMTLLQLEDSTMWKDLLNKILCSKEIIKLGYGGRDDLKFLLMAINVDGQDSQIQSYIDLLTCFQKMQTNFPELCKEIDKWHPPCPSDLPEQKGLSQFCRNVLGKNLNKGEQFSNWEGRPLRESQVTYAALDAYCLLMIYEKLYPLLKKRELDLEKVLTSKSTPVKKQEVKKQEVKKQEDIPKKVEHSPVCISDFRIVVDHNVRGVIKPLRVLGADVACLENSQDNMDAVKIAQNQHRIVITSNRQHKKVLGYLPEEMCFAVDTSVPPKLQVLQILEHFKVNCEDSFLLSRCTVCNCNQYIQIHNEQLVNLWNRHIKPHSKIMKVNRKNTTVFYCDVVAANGIEHHNLPIMLASFRTHVLKNVKEFLVCCGCGKVYWDGSHLKRVKTFMSLYVDIKATPEQSVYKVLSKDESTKESLT